MDIKKLSLEELKNLKNEIEKEINIRNNNKKIIYKCDCFGEAEYHIQKYKHWAKVIEEIDDTKGNGYAFIGEWLVKKSENLVQEGSYVIELNDDIHYTLYRVKETKEKLLEGTQKELITFIQNCKKIIEKEEI